MAKKLLTATFRDGTTITRTTDKDYPFAWLAYGHDKNGKRHVNTGFSGSHLLAIRAADAASKWHTHTPCGTQVVEVVASVPPKKVDPSKAKPWRILESTRNDQKGRFVRVAGAHLRFATQAEAEAEIARLDAANAKHYTQSSNYLHRRYTAYKGK